MRVCVTLAVFATCSVLVADDKPQVLWPIDAKVKGIAVVMPKDGSVLKPTEIKTAEELAKSPLFGEGAAEKVQKVVNFEKEKLVVFAWRGSDKDQVACILATVDKKLTARCYYLSGGTTDLRDHAQIFVLPKNAGVSVVDLPARIGRGEPAKEIPTTGLKITLPAEPGSATSPEIITSAAQLAESPTLKAAANEIKKHVDFDKEKLVFVAWLGSSSDRCSVETSVTATRAVISIRSTPGLRVDLYTHTRLFVVPKGAAVSVAGG